MTPEGITAVVTLAGSITLPSALLFALIGVNLGWWVSGREYRAALAREAEWKAFALKLAGITGTSLDVAKLHGGGGGD